jgi:prepilin-type N-terminal cleavage/methylation domain-containing protein
MKRNNAGLSLVELVVVMAIIAVLSGMSFYGIGQLSTYRARQCAKQVENSLTANKVTTLGKAKKTGNIYWELYKGTDGYYAKTVYNAGTTEEYEETKKVGVSNLQVVYGDSDTSVATTPLRLCYNRYSGAIYNYVPDGTGGTSATTLTDVTKIVIKNPAGTRSYQIDIVPATGKVTRQSEVKKG